MNQKGFTLIELIVTVGLLLLVTSLITPKVIDVIETNRLKSYMEIERRLEDAASEYMLDNINNYIGITDTKIGKDELEKYVGNISDLTKEKNECDAYVEVKNIFENAEYKAYISCKNYVTEGYTK